jgi:hypothetical protein
MPRRSNVVVAERDGRGVRHSRAGEHDGCGPDRDDSGSVAGYAEDVATGSRGSSASSCDLHAAIRPAGPLKHRLLPC